MPQALPELELLQGYKGDYSTSAETVRAKTRQSLWLSNCTKIRPLKQGGEGKQPQGQNGSVWCNMARKGTSDYRTYR